MGRGPFGNYLALRAKSQLRDVLLPKVSTPQSQRHSQFPREVLRVAGRSPFNATRPSHLAGPRAVPVPNHAQDERAQDKFLNC